MSASLNFPFGGSRTNPTGAGQFTLVRSNMADDFTALEYAQCVNARNNFLPVFLQWTPGSAKLQAQLTTIRSDGTLIFAYTTIDLSIVYIVDGAEPHTVTAHTNSF